MSNLKTDDILGARPRIRHAPRNLIRQQKLSPQHMSSNYNPPYAYQYQYPYASQNYPSNDSPRYEPRYVRDVNMSESYIGRSPAGKSSDRIHENNNAIDRYNEDIAKRASQRLFIRPKDAPVVNYDKYQEAMNKSKIDPSTSYSRAYNGLNKDLFEKYNYNSKGNYIKEQPSPLNKSIQEYKSYQMPKIEKQKPRSRSSMNVSSSAQSSSSVEKDYNQNIKMKAQKEERERPKNIFRGLGFNIITNTKFEYGMENRLKNSTSKWLQ